MSHHRDSILFVCFSFSLVCFPPSHLRIHSSLDYLLAAKKNMIYISPHRPEVSRARLIKVDSVTLSPFLFIVLVSIANKPPLLILIVFIFIECAERVSTG